jgi:hypothetical protein
VPVLVGATRAHAEGGLGRVHAHARTAPAVHAFEASPRGDGHENLARPLREEAERAQGHVTQTGIEHHVLDRGDLLARQLAGHRARAGWLVVEPADLGRAVPGVIARRRHTDDPEDQHERQYRLSAGDRAQQAGFVVPRGQPLVTEAEPGGAQQREQEPDDGGQDLLASSQLLDPVQQWLPVLAELFEGDHGPRPTAPPRGGGRARDVEVVELREGAAPPSRRPRAGYNEGAATRPWRRSPSSVQRAP